MPSQRAILFVESLIRGIPFAFLYGFGGVRRVASRPFFLRFGGEKSENDFLRAMLSPEEFTN